MNSVNYQMSLDEHLRIGFRRKVSRPKLLFYVATLLGCGVLLAVGSGGNGPYFYAGTVLLVYGAWFQSSSTSVCVAF